MTFEETKYKALYYASEFASFILIVYLLGFLESQITGLAVLDGKRWLILTVKWLVAYLLAYRLLPRVFFKIITQVMNR